MATFLNSKLELRLCIWSHLRIRERRVWKYCSAFQVNSKVLAVSNEMWGLHCQGSFTFLSQLWVGKFSKEEKGCFHWGFQWCKLAMLAVFQGTSFSRWSAKKQVAELALKNIYTWKKNIFVSRAEEVSSKDLNTGRQFCFCSSKCIFLVVNVKYITSLWLNKAVILKLADKDHLEHI